MWPKQLLLPPDRILNSRNWKCWKLSKRRNIWTNLQSLTLKYILYGGGFFSFKQFKFIFQEDIFQISHPTISDTFLEKDLDFPNPIEPPRPSSVVAGHRDITNIFSYLKNKKIIRWKFFWKHCCLISKQIFNFKQYWNCSWEGVPRKYIWNSHYKYTNTQIHKYGFP